MMSFDQCSYCTHTPRVQFRNINSDEKTKNRQAITQSLVDLKIKVTVNDHYFRCPDCGTYYKFESAFYGTIDSINIRLVRITIFEALAVFRSKFRTAGDFDKAYGDARASQQWRVGTIRNLTKSINATAREFAAETLADYYKKQKKPDKVIELLNNPDPEIRLGTLWSYAEIPWYSWTNSLRLNTWCGILHYKPFGKLSSILKTVITLLYDPDKRIRIIAHAFIERHFIGKSKSLSTKLHRIPKEKWSAEIKQLIIQEIFPGKDKAQFMEVCDFLIDDEEETRRCALSHMYDYYNEKDIPVYIEYIKNLSIKRESPEIKWFLEHPYAGLEKDDDYYD